MVWVPSPPPLTLSGIFCSIFSFDEKSVFLHSGFSGPTTKKNKLDFFLDRYFTKRIHGSGSRSKLNRSTTLILSVQIFEQALDVLLDSHNLQYIFFT